MLLAPFTDRIYGVLSDSPVAAWHATCAGFASSPIGKIESHAKHDQIKGVGVSKTAAVSTICIASTWLHAIGQKYQSTRQQSMLYNKSLPCSLCKSTDPAGHLSLVLFSCLPFTVSHAYCVQKWPPVLAEKLLVHVPQKGLACFVGHSSMAE